MARTLDSSAPGQHPGLRPSAGHRKMHPEENRKGLDPTGAKCYSCRQSPAHPDGDPPCHGDQLFPKRHSCRLLGGDGSLRPRSCPPGAEDLAPPWRAHSLPPHASSPAHLLCSRQLPKCPHVHINTLRWILFPKEEHVGTPTWASTGRVADPLFTFTVRAAIPTIVVTQLEELVQNF